MNPDILAHRIAVHEGEKLSAYPDTEGVLTVGIGHNCIAKPVPGVTKVGDTITREQSTSLFFDDLAESCKELDKFLPWWRNLDSDRQNVMAELCFNMGIHGLLTFTHTLEYTRNGMWDQAADGLAHSKWAAQVGVTRATFLQDALRKGQYL